MNRTSALAALWRLLAGAATAFALIGGLPVAASASPSPQPTSGQVQILAEDDEDDEDGDESDDDGGSKKKRWVLIGGGASITGLLAGGALWYRRFRRARSVYRVGRTGLRWYQRRRNRHGKNQPPRP